MTEIGDPKELICDAVEKSNVQLLVLGSHSRGAITRVFLGSVSNHCVQNVKCPVLVTSREKVAVFVQMAENSIKNKVMTPIDACSSTGRKIAMPTWCHMFNSTLIGADRVWFDELPPESIDSYMDLKAVFLAYFMQQKKYVKDPVEIHNIKQMDGETIKDFMERFKVETGRIKGAPECMRISGFMHGVNNPELTKRLNEHVPKTMEDMMITTTAFIRGEAAAASKKKGHVSWKAQDQSKRQNSNKSGIEGPLVIEAEMGGHMIHRMYMDDGSSMEILYEHCFNRLRPEIKSQMVPTTTSLTGFSGETIWPLGQLRLLVIIGDATHSTRAWMNFMIVKSLSPYNGIIGGSGLRAIQAVPSTVHGMLKFPVEGGIVTIRSTILIPTKCASVITSSVVPSEERTRPANFKVALHPDFPDQEVAIGGTLSDKGRTELCSILKKNLDIFVWQPSDMTGVPRSVAKHRLDIREGYSPVRKKKRGQAPERAKAIQAEVQKLVEAGIMREVYYYDWLSNPVMVKKHDGSWRMCVDFTDLNKACPQDCYPLPEIDWKVESLCGYPFKCFLDAYKGYHQIQLAKPDEEKTAFHTGQGVYCYTKMPFGLKNAVVKSYTEAEMMRDIEETFRTLRKVNMKLNPKKCSFGLAEGIFLGYVVTPEGIKPCPDKTAVVLQQPSPRTIKEFAASNNESEHEALIAGLRIAARMGVKDVHVSVDSKLVANQVLGTYVAKEDNMVKYLERVKSLLRALVQTGTGRNAQRQIHKEEGGGNGDRGRWNDLDDTAEYVMREIHEGSCSMHAGLRSVVAKAIRLGYYWLTMHRDACDMIRRCSDCHIHRPITRNPQQPLTPITSPWPFYKWGIDIAGPFPEGPGKVKFLIVAMDYFTKWIEAKAVATITGGQVKKFVSDNIVCRFGIPGEIVSDNGKQFSDNPFKDWRDKLNITQRFASVKHPQSNGLVERANRIILTETGMPTYRTAAVDVVSNDEELRLNLALLEERRERATICEAKAKSKMMKYYNARVRGVTFKPSDFVYRSNDASHAVAGGKLGPKWEGPYEVTEALENGAYKLRSMDGTILPRTWNIANLKRCYL
nr:reverse transcriptase domain-containing protein [Tanacetum cinerariifolium]